MSEQIDLPPATRHVYRVIRDEGPICVSDIIDETGYSESAVTGALAELRKTHCVSFRIHPQDARRREYIASKNGYHT